MSRRSNLLYPFYPPSPPAPPLPSPPPPPHHCLCLFCSYLSRLPSAFLTTHRTRRVAPPKNRGFPRDRAIDSRLINMIGSTGEEISDRANGRLSPKDIPPLSRDLLSGARRFWERLSVRRESWYPVEISRPREFSSLHDLSWYAPRERYPVTCYVFSRFTNFYFNSSQEKVGGRR